MKRYWLVFVDAGSVWGGTGWHLVVPGQYNLVLLGIKWNWASTRLLCLYILKKKVEIWSDVTTAGRTMDGWDEQYEQYIKYVWETRENDDFGNMPGKKKRKIIWILINCSLYLLDALDWLYRLHLYMKSWQKESFWRWTVLAITMEFVKKFTPPDFQAKNFTPSISPNFNSFSGEKTQKMSEIG